MPGKQQSESNLMFVMAIIVIVGTVLPAFACDLVFRGFNVKGETIVSAMHGNR